MSDAYENIKEDIETKFISIVKETCGKDLVSVLLYGSAARGAYRKDVSDINILIILDTHAPKNIFKLGKAADTLIRKHRISPLITTRKEFIAAADVFPMEYHDIRDSHRVLFGTNETAGLVLTMTNLRHQLEDRLRGAMNDLRHMLIASAGNEKKLGTHLKSWYGVQNALFRGLLRLKRVKGMPDEAKALLEKTARDYGISAAAFTKLNDLQAGGTISPLDVAEGVLEALNSLTAAVDALKD